MPKGGFKKKSAEDTLKELDSDLAASLPGMSDDELNAKIAETAKNDVALRQAKKDDQDLKEKQEAAKEANATYSDGAKRNRAIIEVARSILVARGKE